MTTYIHYGSDHFYPEYFTPIRNGDWRPKPADGTGLWGSRVDDELGWEAWCRENHFNLESLRTSFRFTMSDANILVLDDPEQLISLPKLHPWEPKKPLEMDELPTMEQLKEWFMPNWCYLDFEKLAEEYDAIELRNCWLFRSSLSTWDCNCILVLRPDKVKEVCR